MNLWRLAFNVAREIFTIQMILVLSCRVDVLEDLLEDLKFPDESVGECVFERCVLLGRLKVFWEIRFFGVLVEIVNFLLAVREASHFVAAHFVEHQQTAWNMKPNCVVDAAVVVTSDVVSHFLAAVFETTWLQAIEEDFYVGELVESLASDGHRFVVAALRWFLQSSCKLLTHLVSLDKWHVTNVFSTKDNPVDDVQRLSSNLTSTLANQLLDDLAVDQSVGRHLQRFVVNRFPDV